MLRDAIQGTLDAAKVIYDGVIDEEKLKLIERFPSDHYADMK